MRHALMKIEQTRRSKSFESAAEVHNGRVSESVDTEGDVSCDCLVGFFPLR